MTAIMRVPAHLEITEMFPTKSPPKGLTMTSAWPRARHEGQVFQYSKRQINAIIFTHKKIKL